MEKCRSCGAENLVLVLDLGKQPWGNHFVPIEEFTGHPTYPLEAYFCEACTMVQIGYTVPKELMFTSHNYVSGTTRSLKIHFEKIGEDILKRAAFGPTDYILDIGGNDGTFLEYFHRLGKRVLNVDSGVKQAKLSNDKGIECRNQFFNLESAQAILAERGQALVIHGSGVFFHLEELHSVFEGIKVLLAPKGMVVAEFIYLPEMVHNNAFDQIYHEHLLYYSLKSFGYLLAQHGLEIYDAQLMPIHGGSCIAYIGHQGGHAKTEALAAMIQAEQAGKFDQVETYLEFAKRVATLKNQMTEMIEGLKAEGKSIQALGAPVKGSTIINYCGLDESVIDCAVEINPMKCGTYVPGTRIPVYHQDQTPAPDVYLMLSWNFKTEILEKLKDFRANGGQVLMPIPHPELI
ncbi:MAG: hypothetical protein A2527_01705 [Candidatus Lambdaproteobacteria bacterium RIFOXYD2_FULL_50_16]|uniref:Methyltransferase n=1 Tax=Candidatus Lambdaproteobacteria bacterium RIFOXYD2_FULL_50_16 TaxID=1817772 RepID=A0A1F6G5U4_9PROT|nr:MAG: hypothetical protein A2527_01705 [Candidatus Lambdaproteobacteria bacterium RIFOXYD2_FULL_50_16]